MFESIVSTLINRFLGAYIENFDSKSLNIGIWSGDVRLKNLTLKKESLDKFRLPLDVKFGHLGELTLQIPWSNLKGKPVKVIIEDVYLLASPVILGDFDAEDVFKRTQQIKQEKLKDLEALQRAIRANEQHPTNPHESFTESLVTKIVDNLQVTIKNIHVRYEDDSVLTESPYAFGFTLAELSAASTDEEWLPSFISITQSFTRKLLVLREFACYMNTDAKSVYTTNHVTLLQSLKACFCEEHGPLQYLLNPVSGEGHVVVHKAGATDAHPHVRAELFFDEFGVDFDSHQYRDMLWTASKFHWYQKTWKFRKLRPKTPLQDAPREWFIYAAKSVLNEIHDKHYKWTWDHFKCRRDQRKAYIELWKKKVLKRFLTAEEETQFSDFENTLSYEDIKFYRSLTRTEIRQQNLEAPPTDSQIETGTGGWLSSWWNRAPNKIEPDTTLTPEDEGGLNLALTEEQRKALYDTIDYHEDEPHTELDMPRERVSMEVFVNLKKGGVSLKRDRDLAALAEVIIEGCWTQFSQRADSFLANFQLQEFKIEDGTTKPLYKHIVSVKHDHGQLHTGGGLAETSLSEGLKSDPFFQFSFENNPLDGSADSSLVAKLKSMTIFYNHAFVQEIIGVFTPPKIHLDTVGAIMNAAEATMEGITAQTRIGLQYALEEHKTINVKLDLQAPLVIVPLDPRSWKSPVAILDAGHLSVTSELVEKGRIESFSGKAAYTQDDWAQLHTLMYDKFNLHLQDAQFLVGPTIKDTMEQLHTTTSQNSTAILDNLDFRVSLGVSILPDAAHLAKFRVTGEIPSVNLSLSDFQYKTIMQLVEKLIPTPGSDETESSSVFDAFGNDSRFGEIETPDNALNTELKMEFNVGSKTDLKVCQPQQHLVDIDFKVQRVVVAMYRCIDGVTLEKDHLIDIVGDSLDFAFFRTENNDMHVDLLLTDINVVDHIETSGIAEFLKLVSSNSFLEEETIKKTHPELIKLKYDRTQRIVEHENREIEVFDQDVVLDLAALKCVVSRKSVLSLLAFVLNTFTDPDAEATPADELKHNDASDDAVAPQKINVWVNLDSIVVVLNEDGIKLATLQLSTALIKVLVLPEQMEATGKLGALTLHDESNQGLPRKSVFRSLISIEGDDLAEFAYRTFDPQTHSEAYASAFEFTTAAPKVNFVEDAFFRIFSYLSKFQRMKAIYDSARDAAVNQATNIDSASTIKMDILVRAPIVHFPKIIDISSDGANTTLERNKCDLLVAELGEFYLNNAFDVQENGVLHNLITTGLRKINIHTLFNFENGVVQSGKIVEDLDVSFDIDYVEESIENMPNFTVSGETKEICMKLTELQMRYMNNLQQLISRAFAGGRNPDNDPMQDIALDADQANAVMKHNATKNTLISATVGQQISEKRTAVDSKKDLKDGDRVSVLCRFEIPKIALTLYNRTQNVRNFELCKLCALAVNGFSLAVSVRKNTHFQADLCVSLFTIRDVREGTENKFTQIIAPISGAKEQFSLNASSSGEGDARTNTVMLIVQEPKTLFALDHVFELQAFVTKGLELDPSLSVDGSDGEDGTDDTDVGSISKDSYTGNYQTNASSDSTKISPSSAKVGFSINVINPSIILLADSSKKDTEALVFKVEQVLFSSQNICFLAVENVGMYVVKMDAPEDLRMRLIDDFSLSFEWDARGSTATSLLTSVQVSVDPLLLRISLHDIRLAMKVAERAQGYYMQTQSCIKDTEAGAGTASKDYSISDDFRRKIRKYSPSSVLSLFGNAKKANKQVNNKKSQDLDKIVVRGETLEAVIGGARLVLIGDVHELPVLDMGVKPFEVKVANWLTDLKAETHFETYMNIYNYAKSTWEPLVEAWHISLSASQAVVPKPRTIVEIVSRDVAQVSVSSRSVALLSQIAASITTDVAPKTREQIAPYVILNETGFDIEVWKDKSDEKNGIGESLDCQTRKKTVILRGEQVDWEFEDWRTVRENLDTDSDSNILGVALLDSGYAPIRGIRASGEGEDIFVLSPAVENGGVHNRMVSEITLGSNNVKTIRLRSTFTVENNAEISIAVKILAKKLRKDKVVSTDLNGSKDFKDVRVSKDLKGSRYLKGLRDSKSLKGSEDSNDSEDTKDLRVPKELKASKDFQDSKNSRDSEDSKNSRDFYETEIIIAPGQQRALPIDVVYYGQFKIRPQMEESRLNWSVQSLSWDHLMQENMALQCLAISEINGKDEHASYFFQAEAQFNDNEPLAKVYPHMKVVISAPLEIENLLPYDFNFRLYDKSTRKDWNGTVKNGKSTYVQVVTLQSLLLLSVEPLGGGFGRSEFAIINTHRDTGYKRENATVVKNESGQNVLLRIHYPKNPLSKSSLKVVIYAPYVVLNRTGQALSVCENQKQIMRQNPSQQMLSMGDKGEENTPHLFSFGKEGDQNRAVAKVGSDLDWSAPISFDAIGQVGEVSVQVSSHKTKRKAERNLGVSVAEGEGKYRLTKVVTFAPRYVVRNSLDEAMEVCESGSVSHGQSSNQGHSQNVVKPGGLIPLYDMRSTANGSPKSAAVRFASRDLGGSKSWSAPFALDDIGQVFLKVQKNPEEGQVLLKVDVVTENATIFVQVESAKDAWPFSVRNFSDAEFFLYQSNPNVDANGNPTKREAVDYRPAYYRVPPKSVMPYAYDYPTAVAKELVLRSRGRERRVNLAEIGNLKPFRLPQTSENPQTIVDLNVVADGPTQSLVITPYDPSLSLYKLQNTTATDSSLSVAQQAQNFEVNEEDENYFMKVLTRFEGFGVSFINTRAQELCYLSLRGVELRFNESDLYQTVSAKIKWIQADNQLYGGIFPIIIYPTLVPKLGREMNSHPSFSASVCRVKDDSHGVFFVKYATVLLQELSVEIDEDFLFAVIDFAKFPGASWNSETRDKLCDPDLEIPVPKQQVQVSDVYFEALHLQPALVNLSFVRTERVNAEDRSSADNSSNTLMFFVNMLTMALGNINDAPIKLNALFIENIRAPLPMLMQLVQAHYGQAFFYQLHKILGSADFLGNPVGLFNNLSLGVLDIFYEPYQGFVINDRPQEIGIGIAKGGLSFLKKSVFGFSDSFAKVTSSLAKGLSVATMDRKFQERRRLNQRRNRPKHALYGFTSGANSFFDSLSSGVTGIAQAPIEGATKEGAGGFFKGLGKGVIGLPTKTAIGIFDLASNVSEGIRNTTTVFDADGLEKVRLPRYVSYDGVIRPYSAREAHGQFWLKSVDGGVFFDETYVAHLLLPGEEKAVVVTFRAIVLFEVNSLKIVWTVPFSDVQGVSLETTGICLHLHAGKRGPFLPIPERKSRVFLYSKVKVAVDRYNAQCRVEL